jgi:hypothetical protein
MLSSFNCLRSNNIFIGENLNFTLSREEIWVSSAQEERFEIFLNDKLEAMGWVDIEPIQLSLTWRNNRVGMDGLSK